MTLMTRLPIPVAAPLASLLLGACIPRLPVVDDPCATWEEPGLFRLVVAPDDSKKRDALVYVPASEGPRDLVFSLHGGGMTASSMRDVAQWESLADRDGFVVVYPEGLATLLGFRYWSAWKDRERKDDVAYLDLVAREARAQLCGDRVLATGFSNGGMMTSRWGCQGKQPNALVTAAGPLMTPDDSCDGDPRPIRAYHGTADETVPYEGGPGNGRFAVDYRSAEESIAVFRERNQCSEAEPEVILERGDTTCVAWDCVAATELCTVEGFGHMWPGGANHGSTQANATGDAWLWFGDVVE